MLKILNALSYVVRKLAILVGWETAYLVSYRTQVSGGEVYGQFTLNCRPWLTEGNFEAMQEEGNRIVRKSFSPHRMTGKLVLVSIYRLGLARESCEDIELRNQLREEE